MSGGAADARPAWELASVSGREAARWTVAEARGDELVCDVALEGAYLGETLGGGAARGGPDFGLTLRGLELRTADLARLSGHLGEWLALPPAALADAGRGLTCGMGALFDQRLTLQIGQRADVVSSGRPVATLAFSVGRMRGDFRFVVDASGLRQFTEGIEAVLRR